MSKQLAMGIIDQIKKLRRQPKTEGRYDMPFFKNTSFQKKIAKYGYAIAPLLDSSEVNKLKEDFEELRKMVPEGIPEEFWPSGRTSDPAIRNFAKNAIEAVLPGQLKNYLFPDVVDFIGGTFLVKPPSEVSRLYPHQDSTHVDEDLLFSVYAWVPLCDVDEFNGCMGVIPGSHLFGNIQRSLNVPWQFHGLEELMLTLMKPVPMKAGEVMFFDSGLIHHSPKNQSKDYRVAVNYYLKPKGTPFLHYYMDDKTPEGKVEMFDVDIDFFYNCDFESRPPDRYKFLGYTDHKKIDLTPEEFEQMCLAFEE